ncbi:MAG: NUDIX hydrolase, partial [Candidatus Omnitrophica bacterium]|nr:NUDIX hydrolase [Candidatus Omnitrophota bacterium]
MKIKFNGRLIKVYEHKCVLPNGYPVKLEIVKHPGAVLIVPFISKNKIIMLKQYRPVIKKYIFELPAGTLAEKEKHLICARRELKEETGYIAKKFVRIGEIYPACGYTTERIIIFTAFDLKQ